MSAGDFPINLYNNKVKTEKLKIQEFAKYHNFHFINPDSIVQW